MFEVPAAAYDRYMGVYSAQLAAQLADLAGVRSGQEVLDVGCGTGALTAELVERLGPEAVAAVDPSESFVAATRERHPGVDVKRSTAEELPFPDAIFDAALAQLVVHFMSDPVAGLREMARVTRRDGVVAACVWDIAGARAPMSTFWQAARDLDSGVDDESDLPGVRAGDLTERFRTAGIADVTEDELNSSVTYSSFEDWWKPFMLGAGPAGAYAATLEEEHRERLRDRCRQLLPEAPFTIHAVAWAARGAV
jgi:SAM-dependent methyltransferase